MPINAKTWLQILKPRFLVRKQTNRLFNIHIKPKITLLSWWKLNSPVRSVRQHGPAMRATDEAMVPALRFWSMTRLAWSPTLWSASPKPLCLRVSSFVGHFGWLRLAMSRTLRCVFAAEWRFFFHFSLLVLWTCVVCILREGCAWFPDVLLWLPSHVLS